MLNIFSLIILNISLFSSFSLAAPSTVAVRAEEGRWIAEVISIKIDGWPEVQLRKTFANKSQALVQKEKWLQDPQFSMQSNFQVHPQMVSGELWPTTQTWSEAWEIEYSHWIENDVDADFFVKYKIATDCADVAYSLRWIFSRMHGLPAAARFSGMTMSNETLRSEWAKLPTSKEWNKDRRFLAALNYMLDMTYTHTLWEDSFPVALTKEAILSGSYHLSLKDDSGHTQLIRWLSANSGIPFLTLNSTVPRKVQSLMESLLFADFPKDKKGAILRFRWPIKTNSGMQLKKANEMPGYSLEQFSFKSNSDFPIALFEKLGASGGMQAIRDYLYQDIYNLFQARILIVNEGFEKCQKMDCSPGSAGWENWSTLSRDSRLKGKLVSLQSISSRIADSPPEIENKEVLVAEELSWTFKSILWNWKFDVFSSDPRMSILKRWGAGNSTWISEQIEFFKNKVTERKILLEKAAIVCKRQDCLVGTPSWDQYSTSKIDLELKNRIQYLGAGNNLPEKLNVNFKAAKEKELANLDGHSITINHLIVRINEMNASPSADLSDQWSLKEEIKMFRAMYNSQDSKRYFRKWYLSKYNNLFILNDSKTGQELQLPGKILAAFTDVPFVLLEFANIKFLWDLQSGKRGPDLAELENLNELDIIASMGSNLAIRVNDKIRIWQMDVAKKTLNKKMELPSGNWVNLSYGILQNQNKVLFDLQYLKYLPQIDLNNLFAGNEKYIIYFESFTKREYFILNRQNGKNVSFPVLTRFISNLDFEKHEMLVLDSQSTLLHWDDDLNFKIIQKFNGICNISISDIVSCFTPAGKRFYKNHENEWQLIFEGKDVVDANENIFIKKIDENSIGVYSHNKQLIFKAENAKIVNGYYVIAANREIDYANIFDVRNLSKPYFTNVYKKDYEISLSKEGAEIIIDQYLQDRPGKLFWKQDVL